MKAFLVLITGTLPLALLTLVNLAHFWSGDEIPELPPAEAAGRPRESIAAASQLAEIATEHVRSSQPIVAQLAGLNFLGTAPIVKLDHAGEVAVFAGVVRHWPDNERAQAAIRAYAEVYRGKPQPEAELSRLEALLAKKTLSGVPGGERLSAYLSERMESLQQRRVAEQLLERARGEFTAQRLEDCLKTLDSIRTGPLPPSEVREVADLKRRVLFQRHWSKRPLGRELTVARLTKLRELRAQSPEAVTLEEQAQLKKMDQQIQSLSRQLRLAAFLKAPPTRVAEFLREANAIVTDEPRSRPKLVAKFNEWLILQLKEKKGTGAGLIQEARRKDGSLVKGVFKPGSDDNTNPKTAWYQYWSTEAAFRSKGAYEQTIYLSNLAGPPELPWELRAATEFNLQRRDVLKNLDSKPAWEAFAATCARLNQELEDYRGVDGASPGTLTFDEELQLAQEVLSSWEALLKLSAK